MKKIYPPDWSFAIAACFTCWFRPNLVLQRRIDFITDACSDERKKKWPFRLLTSIYKLKIERGYPYRRLKPEEIKCGTKCEIRHIGEDDTEVCPPANYDGKYELTNNLGWHWIDHTINPATLQFVRQYHAAKWLRIKNRIWFSKLRF